MKMEFLLSFASMAVLFSASSIHAEAEGGIGVNYGMIADNLPSPAAVVSLYQSRNITKLRLFHPDAAALKALQNSGISVILGTLNEDLPSLAAGASAAASWVASNVLPYTPSVTFRAIAAGNELIPGNLAPSVLPSIRNLRAALLAVNLTRIPVTTAVSTEVLSVSYPPSSGEFSAAAAPTMSPLLSYLAAQAAPLMVNVYPYFAYAADPEGVQLGYALFGPGGPAVKDGGLVYTNMFDAMVDAVHAAAGKRVEVVVTETGWPSGGGGEGATVENAAAYNNKLVKHVGTKVGTPMRPGKEMEVYLFAMFNENLKPEGTERNFGLFHPDMTEVYHVDFNSSSS